MDSVNKRIEHLQAHGDGIPEHLYGGIARYIEKGINMGGCMTSFASNDLFGFYNKADHEVKFAGFAIARYFYNYAPACCYGSSEEVDAWRGIAANP